MTTDGSPPVDRLDSWKAIAEYLDRDVATVRRWEQLLGLPVRRVAGVRGGSVFAFKSEIDVWLQQDRRGQPAEEVSPPAPAAKPSRVLLAAGLVTLVAVAVTAAWWLWPSAVDVRGLRVEVVRDGVVAKSSTGEEVWRDRLSPGSVSFVSEVGRSVQLVSGGVPAVYAANSHSLRGEDQAAEGGALVSYRPDGRRRWAFSFDDTLRFGGRDFGAPWPVTDFSVEGGDPRRIAVAAHHYTWNASMVAILDDTGRRLSTFAHSGWIENVHWVRSRLVIGGFSNARNGGMVALLDPAHANGQGAEDPGEHHCDNCGPDRAVRMAVMPRSEVNRLTHSRFNRAVIEVTPDRVIARTIEVPSMGQEAVDAIYEFTPDLQLIGASFSARYWEIHAALEGQGRVDHPAAACPDRAGPREILVWSPDSGWKPQAIAH